MSGNCFDPVDFNDDPKQKPYFYNDPPERWWESDPRFKSKPKEDALPPLPKKPPGLPLNKIPLDLPVNVMVYAKSPYIPHSLGGMNGMMYSN